MPLDYPDPDLLSDVVRLRRWGLDDLQCVAEASTDPTIPQGTTVPAVFSEEEGRAFIERQWGRQISGQGLSLAITDSKTDEALGLVYLGLGAVRGECHLGYWLIPSARGRGLGTAAVRLASHWVLTATEIHRLVAEVKPDNAASIALLRKLGFTKEGVLRSWLWIGESVFDALQFSLLTTDVA